VRQPRLSNLCINTAEDLTALIKSNDKEYFFEVMKAGEVRPPYLSAVEGATGVGIGWGTWW
jgi:hypothetical protein